MWDEIMDMPGEIFDITDETRDEMAEWQEEQEENETPGWDLWGWSDPCSIALETDKILMDLMTV